MAHAEPFPLPAPTLQAFTKQVGSHALAFRTLTEWDNLSLREAFAVWALPLDALSAAKDSIRTVARDTNRWHHQLYNDDAVVGYVRSQPSGLQPSDWQVCEVFASGIAESIADTIRWIDENVLAGDPTVRLLVLPAFHTYAFWLFDVANDPEGVNDRIVVADRPPVYSSLQLNTPYSVAVFLTVLQSLQPIVGITP